MALASRLWMFLGPLEAGQIEADLCPFRVFWAQNRGLCPLPETQHGTPRVDPAMYEML
jgi:hypothetical protein